MNSEHATVRKLEKFLAGEYAQSLNDLKLEDRDIDHIHKDLMGRGFIFHESEFTLEDDETVFPHLLYVNQDGGMVRIKPKGNGTSLPFAYAVKCVLIDPNDYSYESEIFKVSDEGIPMPKGIQETDFINLDESVVGEHPHKSAWLDWVMGQVHMRLKE